MMLPFIGTILILFFMYAWCGNPFVNSSEQKTLIEKMTQKQKLFLGFLMGAIFAHWLTDLVWFTRWFITCAPHFTSWPCSGLYQSSIFEFITGWFSHVN